MGSFRLFADFSETSIVPAALPGLATVQPLRIGREVSARRPRVPDFPSCLAQKEVAVAGAGNLRSRWPRFTSNKMALIPAVLMSDR